MTHIHECFLHLNIEKAGVLVLEGETHVGFWIWDHTFNLLKNPRPLHPFPPFSYWCMIMSQSRSWNHKHVSTPRIILTHYRRTKSTNEAHDTWWKSPPPSSCFKKTLSLRAYELSYLLLNILQGSTPALHLNATSNQWINPIDQS